MAEKKKNDGFVKIPIKNGTPDFEKICGTMGGEPLSNEKCMGIVALGYQYWQTIIAGRAMLMAEDENKD